MTKTGLDMTLSPKSDIYYSPMKIESLSLKRSHLHKNHGIYHMLKKDLSKISFEFYYSLWLGHERLIVESIYRQVTYAGLSDSKDRLLIDFESWMWVFYNSD